MKESVRIGYVGLGRRGTGVLDACFSEMPDVELVALCDVDTARMDNAQALLARKNRPAAALYTDYREMLRREKLDAVIIMTGWNQRLNIAMDAMEAGIPTGIEVGCAYDLTECWNLVDTYERTGTPVMMLENCCYGRREMAVLKMARENFFGDIVLCTGGYLHDLRREDLLHKNEDGIYEVNHYRMAEYVHRNCEQYPTHELGPISKVLRLNRGNRMLRLRSIPSAAKSLAEFSREQLPADHPYYNAKVLQGDIITTIIDCAGGEQIILTLDTTLPRAYYSRNFGVRGTKGLVEEVKTGVATYFRDGDEHVFNNEKEWLDENDHPLHKEYKNSPRGGHGGMDWLVMRAFVESVKKNIAPPIDVYDTALWLSIAPLSEMSIAQDGAPVAVPDFTRGKWFCREAPISWKFGLDTVCEDPDTPIFPEESGTNP